MKSNTVVIYALIVVLRKKKKKKNTLLGLIRRRWVYYVKCAWTFQIIATERASTNDLCPVDNIHIICTRRHERKWQQNDKESIPKPSASKYPHGHDGLPCNRTVIIRRVFSRSSFENLNNSTNSPAGASDGIAGNHNQQIHSTVVRKMTTSTWHYLTMTARVTRITMIRWIVLTYIIHLSGWFSFLLIRIPFPR